MSESSGTPDDANEPTKPDELRADIERTRAELADTVDELSERLNVKAQVGGKAESLKQSTAEKLASAKASAPPPVQNALDSVGAKAGPIAHQVSEKTEGQRGKIAGGAIAAVAALLLVRRIRGRRTDGKGKKK